MTRHNHSRLTALFCLFLATAGCAADPDRSPEAQAVADTVNVVFHHGKWRQVPATPEYHVETIIFEQRVAFNSSAPSLDRPGHHAIDRLLQEATPEPGSLIGLSVGTDQSGPATYGRLTLQRLEAVRLALADRGFQSALATDEAGRVASLHDGEIGLTVTKVMPILPDCDQPQPLAPDKPDFNATFGCSNVNNLSVMVADPADLKRGRRLEPADAEAASLSIQRYRIGEITPLKEEDTKSQ